MRKIIGAAFVSLDGVMQAPGGPSEDPTGGFRFSGWLPPVGDDGIEDKIGELFGRPFDLLLGRRTYDIFAAYWPYAPDEMAAIRDTFNACNKYVLTHGDQPLAWENSQRVAAIEDLRSDQAKRRPRPRHPGQQHALSAAARGRAARRADADDFPGRARRGQAAVRRRHPAADAEDDRPPASPTGGTSSPPTSRPARSRSAATSPANRASGNRRARRRWRTAAGDPSALRAPVQQLHAEGADRALGRRDARSTIGWSIPDIRRIWRSFKRRSPFGMFPLLVDDGEPVFESTPIIEHLHAHHRGPERLDPGRRSRAPRPLPRPLLRHLCDGQHAEGRARRPAPRRLARPVRSRAGAGRAAHRL